MLEVGLYQLLSAAPSLAAVGGRVYMGTLPKDYSLPAVVLQTVVTADVYHTQGASGLRDKKVQIDSYAGKYSDALAASDAIRALLQSFAGGLPDGTLVNGALVNRDMDFPYEEGLGGYVFRRLLEIDFWYTENVSVVAGNIVPGPGAHLRYPAGALDGVNRVFALAPVPLDAATVLIFRNGQALEPSADYAISGATLTLNVAPAADDDLFGYW